MLWAVGTRIPEMGHITIMVTAPVALVAIAAVGAAASAYGAYAASEAQASAADYNRKVARNQAVMAQQQADIDLQNLTERQRRLRGSQRAAIAGTGVEEEGSPLLAMADTERQMARDRYLVKYGGEARATAFENEARLQGF